MDRLRRVIDCVIGPIGSAFQNIPAFQNIGRLANQSQRAS